MTLHANDLAGLEAAVGPEPRLRELFARTDLPGHDWLLSVLLEVSPGELGDVVSGRRRAFSFAIPSDLEGVRGSGVFCARCQLTWQQMSETERQGCRGETG